MANNVEATGTAIAKVTPGASGSNKSGLSPDAIRVAAVVVGFFVVSPLARWNPVLVNGFLLLVLLSSLLLTQARWLPYITTKGNQA